MRKPLPSSWGGKTKDELFEITGIDTLYFCHKNLFTCACDTKEDALKIVNMALLNKEYDKKYVDDSVVPSKRLINENK